MKSIAELKDQLTDARSALEGVEQELRRAELLVETEGGTPTPIIQHTLAAQHVR